MNDNPPAFPHKWRSKVDGDHYDRGMSLRDWFAGQAGSAPEDYPFGGFPQSPPDWTDEAAAAHHQTVREWWVARQVSWATSYADAMLAARKAGEA